MSDLIGNPEDRFSRVEAQICTYLFSLKCRISVVDRINEAETEVRTVSLAPMELL